MSSPKTTARIAGIVYLLLILFGVFAQLYVRQGVLVSGDAAATANNIMANTWLFKLGFVSDLVMLTCYVSLGLVLYMLLESFGKFSAIFMVACVLVGSAITWSNMLNHYQPILLLSNADYLNVFSPEQLNALALLSLDMHAIGYASAQPFFGLWLLPFGFLGLKSDYFPQFLSIALMISAITYVIDFLLIFLFPEYQAMFTDILMLPTIIGEFGICLWLLIKGVKDNPKSKRILESVAN